MLITRPPFKFCEMPVPISFKLQKGNLKGMLYTFMFCLLLIWGKLVSGRLYPWRKTWCLRIWLCSVASFCQVLWRTGSLCVSYFITCGSHNREMAAEHCKFWRQTSVARKKWDIFIYLVISQLPFSPLCHRHVQNALAGQNAGKVKVNVDLYSASSWEPHL